MNKKGLEQQRIIIYILFVAILLTFAIIMIYNFIAKVNVELDFRIKHLEETSITARLIYSPDCFALEEVSPCEVDKYQVRPGILDLSKLNPNRFKRCLNEFTERYRVYLEVDTLEEVELVEYNLPIVISADSCSDRSTYPISLEHEGQYYDGKIIVCMEKK